MNYLKLLRIKNNKTQREVIEYTGIKKARVIHSERDDTMLINNFNYTEIKLLAELYNTTVEKLITDYENGEYSVKLGNDK